LGLPPVVLLPSSVELVKEFLDAFIFKSDLQKQLAG
jgi:hypothetical protein